MDKLMLFIIRLLIFILIVCIIYDLFMILLSISRFIINFFMAITLYLL